MEKSLIPRGVLAGALGGLLAFVFAWIFIEPRIDAAIEYETGRDAAQTSLDRAAGVTVEHGDHELFSRGVQAGVGAGVGTVLFGMAMGALVAVVCAVYWGRISRAGGPRPRALALLVAAGGFLALYLLPFLKYPANPPSVGHPDTIGARTGLYLAMVICSVAFLAGAVWLAGRLRPRFGEWNAHLLAGAAFLVAIGAVMAVLPSLGHVGGNVASYGDLTTETPLPLRDPSGAIVYPGFPADLLYAFRLYSVGAQLVLWAVIGLVFGALAERLLAPTIRATSSRASGGR